MDSVLSFLWEIYFNNISGLIGKNTKFPVVVLAFLKIESSHLNGFFVNLCKCCYTLNYAAITTDLQMRPSLADVIVEGSQLSAL